VREALELCVSCKGCKRECPTGVDMARMKIEFLAAHRERHGFTRRDKLVAHLPRYAQRFAWLLPFASRFGRFPGARTLAARFAGFDPRRPLPVFRAPWTTAREAKAEAEAGREIVLFADTFNNHFEGENLSAARRVLEATGHRVVVARGEGRALCCGRTYLTTRMVGEARVEARRTVAALAPFIARGVPVVGLEPSCVMTFRDEYAALFPRDADAGGLAGVQLLDEYLAAGFAQGKFTPPWKRAPATDIRVHGHCHQKAFGAFDATLAVLKTLPGARVSAIESSCCGMAGAFGHEHYDESMAMGELSLLPAVRDAAPDAAIVASGTSCRQQVCHGAGREAVHPAVLLARAL